MEETLNNDYELLEHYSTEDESKVFQYLRHKKTGLEIAYYQRETKETGFSFCFKTPVEDPYLGTTHVLEHCVMTGSQKYDLDFIYDLVKYSYYSNYNACTTEDRKYK